MDFPTAISRLWSFHHETCDRALVRAHVDVWGVKLTNGIPADDSLYGGSAFVILWSVAVVWASVELWTGRKTLAGRFRVGPAPHYVKVLALIGPALSVLILSFQGRSIMNYVEACSNVLHVR